MKFQWRDSSRGESASGRVEVGYPTAVPAAVGVRDSEFGGRSPGPTFGRRVSAAFLAAR